MVLVPDVLERTPPYVDEVRAGSPAETGRRSSPTTWSCSSANTWCSRAKDLREELAPSSATPDCKSCSMRGQELIEVDIPGGERPQEPQNP